MLLAENFDNGGPRGVAVAENPRQIRLFAKGSYNLGRKARTILRKIAPLERHGRAGDLPVAGWRVFAAGCLDGGAVTCVPNFAFEAGRNATCGKAAGFAKPKTDEIGQL